MYYRGPEAGQYVLARNRSKNYMYAMYDRRESIMAASTSEVQAGVRRRGPGVRVYIRSVRSEGGCRAWVERSEELSEGREREDRSRRWEAAGEERPRRSCRRVLSFELFAACFPARCNVRVLTEELPPTLRDLGRLVAI